MEILVAVIAGLVAILVIWLRSPSRKMPPGPWGLPIVGYLPFLTKKPYLKMTELAKRYGGVFNLRLGSFDVIILNDFPSTKEAFAQDAFIGRPPTSPFELNKETMESGAFYGIQWKEQRRHCLHMLRDLGFGKTKMEEQLQEEIRELLDHFEMKGGAPFKIRPLLAPSMSNNIAALVFGKRLTYDNPVRQMLMRSINEITAAAGQVAWTIFFPRIKKILKLIGVGDVDRLNRISLEMRNYIQKEIDEHEETLNPDNVRDFIDSYLLESRRRKNDPCFKKYVLHDLAGAFFGAGSETVRQSVEWLVLACASDPKAQRRIQAEIQEVIGSDRMPIWEDHKNMPYTYAFMMEMQRWRTLIPLNLLRYTLTDTELNGYFIPAHTHIMANLWAIHHDPKYWGSDADEFRPERFLSDDGKEVIKHECYIPFSIGKRSCPGEPLAKVEIFLYFMAILQRFDIRLPEGKVADFEGDLGIGYQPKPQEVVMTKRD